MKSPDEVQEAVARAVNDLNVAVKDAFDQGVRVEVGVHHTTFIGVSHPLPTVNVTMFIEVGSRAWKHHMTRAR